MRKVQWVLLSLVGWLLLMACSAETAEPIATAIPPTAVPPTAVVQEVVEEVAEVAVEETVAEEPVALQGVELNGYTNVIYTEADGNLIGATGKPQFVQVYANW